MGEMFCQLEEETGKITFLERFRQYFAALLGRIFDTLAPFYDPFPTFGAYFDIITNSVNEFPILQDEKDEILLAKCGLSFMNPFPGATLPSRI